MEFQSGAVQPVESIKEGWEIIKSDYWLFFAMTLVSIIIVLILSFALNLVVIAISGVISAGLGVATQNAGEAGAVSAALLPQLISMILGIFTGLAQSTLSAMLVCGIYIAISRKANGDAPEFGDLFAGFQYFQQCFVVSLVLTLINFVFGATLLVIGGVLGVSAFGAGLLTQNGGFNPNLLGPLFGIIIVILLASLIFTLLLEIFTNFVYPLITEHKLSAIEALSLSAKAGLGNFFGLFVFFILQFLIILLGLIACVIGVLFVMPIVMASIFAAYLRVFGKSQRFGRRMPPPPPFFGNQRNA